MPPATVHCPLSTVECAGIILCGGKSTRMGQSKAWLPFGPEPMLARVVRILSEVVAPVVVVAARDQDLPPLPAGVEITRDEYDSLGPLAGLAAGLAALRGHAEAAYATSCDAPLLRPEFVRHMIAALGDYDLAIPREAARRHPLAAVYRVSLESTIRGLISQNRLRLVDLPEHCRAREIDPAELRAVDPELLSLRNANTPGDYAAALEAAGFEAPGGRQHT
jgi:molybdopterin-guanine dinucleotide biosynthesis protein A